MIDLEQFKDIDAFLFDLGGVIIDIDPQRTINLFKQLGLKGIEDQIAQSHHIGLFKTFERGDIGEQEFIATLKSRLTAPVEDDVLIETWNSILVNFPQQRVRILEELKKRYPVYLLSNTNPIHLRKFRRMAHGHDDFEHLFTDVFYSFRLRCSKPEKCAFRKVMEQTGLNPSKTLFLDDSEVNLQAAAKLGFQTRLVSARNPMEKIFK